MRHAARRRRDRRHRRHEVFAAALPLAHRIYKTEVHASPTGDAFFPAVDWREWREVSREALPRGPNDDSTVDARRARAPPRLNITAALRLNGAQRHQIYAARLRCRDTLSYKRSPSFPAEDKGRSPNSRAMLPPHLAAPPKALKDLYKCLGVIRVAAAAGRAAAATAVGRGARAPAAAVSPPDLEEMLKRGQDKVKQVMHGGGVPGPLLFLVAVVACAVIAWQAFTFRVNPDELGVVMRFGKFVEQYPPGLHFRLPYPIEEVRCRR